MNRMPKFSRMIAGGLPGLPCLGVTLAGAYMLSIELRIHLGNPFYVDLEYVRAGVLLLVFGGFGLLIALRHILNPEAASIMLVVPLGCALVGMQIPPSNAEFLAQRVAAGSVTLTLTEIRQLLVVWGEAHGRFPDTETQLAQVVLQAMEKPSRYAQHGLRLPYRIRQISQATGPHLQSQPDTAPATIYYAVSADSKTFWLTATMLDTAVATESSLLKNEDGDVVLYAMLASFSKP